MSARNLQIAGQRFRCSLVGAAAVAVFASSFVGCSTTTVDEPNRPGSSPGGVVEPRGCLTPLGELKDGDKAYGYLRASEPVGKSCEKGALVCHDGIWTGDYVHPACKTDSEVEIE